MNKKRIINYSIVFLLLIVLEATVFNFSFYRTFFSSCEVEKYYFEKGENASILNIDKEVKSIYVKIENTENVAIDYSIVYCDDTTDGGRSMQKSMYYDKNERSHYSSLFLSGNAKSIMIGDAYTFYYDYSYLNDLLYISEIDLNPVIPFNFRIDRVLILFVIIVLIDSYRKDEFWKEKWQGWKNKKQYFVLFAIILSVISIAFIFNTSYHLEISDLYHINFVDALKKGSFNVEVKTDRLKELDNPYDTALRNYLQEYGEDYIWDSAYYKDKFYVYYGILPALLLFLPFNLLTGEYLPSSVGVLIFSVFSIVALSRLILFIFKKYFKELPFKLLALSLCTLLFRKYDYFYKWSTKIL